VLAKLREMLMFKLVEYIISLESEKIKGNLRKNMNKYMYPVTES